MQFCPSRLFAMRSNIILMPALLLNLRMTCSSTLDSDRAWRGSFGCAYPRARAAIPAAMGAAHGVPDLTISMSVLKWGGQ